MVKASFKLYRAIAVPRHWFASLLDLPENTTGNKLEEKLRTDVGRLPPRMKIWWGPPILLPNAIEGTADLQPLESKTVVGMEALSFDMTERNIPFGALCSTDPMVAEDVARADGALAYELERWGMTVEFQDFTWVAEFDVTGQEIS